MPADPLTKLPKVGFRHTPENQTPTLHAYECLEDARSWLRKHGALSEALEDAMVNDMDALWTRMSDREREYMNAKPPSVSEKQAARDLTIAFTSLPGIHGEIEMARRGYQSGDVPPAEGEPSSNPNWRLICHSCGKRFDDNTAVAMGTGPNSTPCCHDPKLHIHRDDP